MPLLCLLSEDVNIVKFHKKYFFVINNFVRLYYFKIIDK